METVAMDTAPSVGSVYGSASGIWRSGGDGYDTEAHLQAHMGGQMNQNAICILISRPTLNG